MKVKQIHKNIGVSIEGIDLSKIDENTFKKIKDLWEQYLIVIFPKQDISDEDHMKCIPLYLIGLQKTLKFIVCLM